jgi:hypothetical protein
MRLLAKVPDVLKVAAETSASPRPLRLSDAVHETPSTSVGCKD